MHNLSALATAPGHLIAPSMISSDLARMTDEVQALEAAGADWLHVDVMDGDFVPNITIGICVVEALKRVTKLPLDCHLMIQHPERFAGAFVKAGAFSVSVHPEAAGDQRKALEDIRAAGGHPALALKPATPVSAAEPFADMLDMLLIMTVNPGFSGQKMMLDCLPKYAEARAKFGPDLLLEIDGGVAAANAAQVRAAGAQVLVAATAIFGSHDYPTAVRALRG
jgi:ribulose-phosphate 3-epimerase